MKTKYKLSTGLSEIIERPEFTNDVDAWNYLRKQYSANKFAILYKQIQIDVPILNRKEYVEIYNNKYTLQKIGDTNLQTYWIPVLQGLTFDEATELTFANKIN